MKQVRFALLALVAAAATVPTPAGDGRIPLWQPAVIMAPGHYVVTRDIMAATGPIFDIQVEGVTMDLNGHTLSVSGAAQPVLKIASLLGIEPEPFRFSNGRIVGGLHGLHVPAGLEPCIRLSDLSFEGQAGAAVRIEGLKSLEANGIIVIDAKVGFEIQPVPEDQMPTVRITGAQIRAGGGIHCTNAVCSIRESTLRIVPPADGSDNTPAILFQGARGEAVGIIVVDVMPVGMSPMIDLRDSKGIIVVDVKVGVIGAGGAGAIVPCLVVDPMCRDILIEGGSFTGCGGDGIMLLGSDSSIRGSLINDNGGNGVTLRGSNLTVENLRLAGNDGAGIWFESSGHIYRGNLLRGQGGPTGGLPFDGPGLPGSTDGGGNIP